MSHTARHHKKSTSHQHKMPALSHWATDVLYLVAGIICSSFALKSFLIPNKFLDGGVTGISLLLHGLFHWNIEVLILLINIPFLILGIFQVNLQFAIKTFVCIIGLAVCLHFIPFPLISSDKLIVAVFGGVFLGTGVGLVMRGGCSLDGIEVLALYTLKRSSFTISEIILGINVIIFSIAALKFGIETALYSMLTYYAASKTISFVVEGLEEYTGVTIISGKSEIIKKAMVMQLGRGITVYKGERGFLKDSFHQSDSCDIIFTVITRLEVRRLRNAIHAIDPAAFVFTNTIKEAAGGVLKRKASH
jgi:uncharacterized membrane-anchored protein YitT (DUF2179 family)